MAHTQQPIISPPGGGDELILAGNQVFHRAKSGETDGVFSVVELVSKPGTGVSVHVHDNEDELVYVVEGEIEVTLGDQSMKATKGVMALLPRGIPHGYTNVGDTPSRVLDVILPGKFDNYFVKMHNLYLEDDGDSEKADELAREYGIRYL
ncbi:cupin domain-containing protein [candidate division KSB1 bacterium]|nr:cupin domain-containing protein [candidate division KSB1 bacterium]NIR70866.1 cupin domain-containing protein [candidate division KSB1 bacterium]NIS24652.1 cupin domain-containing protein [candidate division KSB1 bacterium]NIT71554.1 cupin domain-containing protein [candidate division KSB1 bacterium]NIU25252.1 cupin domain-containing protein [candidate division KSB1 bacterium]